MLGDAGAGFWMGREVARAVTADLDGTGPATALTPALLAEFGLVDDRRPREGRAFVLGEIVDLVYGTDPVRLARLAPACFAVAAAGDPVARSVVAAAQEELASLVRPSTGPGLSSWRRVWRRGAQGPPSPGLRAALAGRTVLPAEDGLLGAAALALRAIGLPTLALEAFAPQRELRGLVVRPGDELDREHDHDDRDDDVEHAPRPPGGRRRGAGAGRRARGG